MITVKKGEHEMIVTKGTFERQLKPLGYQIASKENKGAAEKVAPFVKKEDKKIEKVEPEVEEEKAEEEKAEEEKVEEALDEEFGFKKGKKGSK